MHKLTIWGLAVALLTSSSPSQDPAKGVYRFGKLGLTLDLSGLSDLKRTPVRHSQIVAEFNGTIGAVECEITLWRFPRADFRFEEPDGIAKHICSTDKPPFRFTRQEFVDGPFGYVPYAVVADAPVPGQTDTTRHQYFTFGILQDYCYQVRAITKDALKGADLARLRAFLTKGVRYDGEVRNARWTDDDARRRWEAHTQSKFHDQLKIRRTKHYIILFNAGGALFAKKMEVFYKKIRKTFPFPEVKGRRLMPVFIFRTKQQYHHYSMSVAGGQGGAGPNSKGHAWRDYYATYYESPNDPVHIHEATHQIFSNRLNLSGGGSWFQEGVADYMSENRNDIRSSVRNQIKNNDYMKFKLLMVVPSLLGSLRGGRARGGSRARAAYLQSASIVTFLRESKFGKKRFLDYVHAVGSVRRGDLAAIEAAIQGVYGIGIDELEQKWKKHWRR